MRWRKANRPRISRKEAAESLSAEVQHQITETVIRDLELGRSTKWLPDYVSFARNNWDPQFRPKFSVIKHLTKNESPFARMNYKITKLKIYRNSVTPESQLIFRLTQEEWSPPIPLPGMDMLYSIIQIVGSNFFEFAPHGSYLLFKGVEVPCEGDFIAVSSGDSLTLGTLTIIQDRFFLDSGEPVSLHDVKGHLIGIFFAPSSTVYLNGQMIAWNAGEAIRLRKS